MSKDDQNADAMDTNENSVSISFFEKSLFQNEKSNIFFFRNCVVIVHFPRFIGVALVFIHVSILEIETVSIRNFCFCLCFHFLLRVFHRFTQIQVDKLGAKSKQNHKFDKIFGEIRTKLIIVRLAYGLLQD